MSGPLRLVAPESGGAAADQAAGTGPGVLVHVHDNDVDHLTAVLRNITNLTRDLGGVAPVEVVAHGAGLDLVLASGSWAGQVTELQATGGVLFLGCANSLRGRDLTAAALTAGVGVVPSGVGHLTRRQWQGWAYLHP